MSWKGNKHLETGKQAEDQAERFLQQHSLTTLVRNYRCKLGEIDLIMRDKDQIVFVEVRFRTIDAYGDSASSITKGKQKKIIRAASYFLQQKNWLWRYSSRFDVIATSGQKKIEWIKNAFLVEY